jgi:conjugative relaxase-like TrwC/TraI family protein
MFTIKVQTVKEAAEKYFDNHLSVGEFVSEGEDKSAQNGSENLVKYYADQPIIWSGNTAELLGISAGSVVKKETFSELLNGVNPATKKQLTARQNDFRRLYFDVTSSAPKSVSIMAITMGDHRLIRAHEEATKFALSEIEKFTQTRVRTSGQNTIRKTSNFLCANTTHTTSRANDPQLHSHNLIFNVTWDETDKKFKALEAYEIYNNLEFFTEIYRSKLAEKTMALGYKIERAKHGWEIKGVSHEICTLFSKRSASIKEAEKSLEAQRGRPITNYERAIISERTRTKKSKILSHKDVIEFHKSELTTIQLRSLENLHYFAKMEEKEQQDFRTNFPNLGTQKTEPSLAEKEAVSFAVSHVFERQSVVKKTEIITLALKSNYGKLNEQNLEKVLENTKGLIWNKENGTIGTIEGLSQEFFITSFVQNQKDIFTSKLLDPTKNLPESLRPDQFESLKMILENKDRVMILEGGAGSGKSHLLKALVSEIDHNGFKTTATAPTTGATNNLTLDLGVEASTIQRILHKPSFYEKSLKDGYLIVDEAGLLSLKQMEALFLVAEKYNTQMLLVGDTRQHHSVEAGDALRILKNYTDINIARLTQIERQKDPTYKEAVLELQNHNVQKGWEIFEQMKVIHSKDDYLRSLGKDININNLEKKLDYERLYLTYLNKRASGKSVVVVTPTRSEVDLLTKGIRETLSGSELKEAKIQKEVFASTRFSGAEKMNINNYIARENTHFVVMLDKQEKFKKGSTWKVKDIKEDHLILEDLKTKEQREFNPKNFLEKNFDVMERKTIEIKEGETLLIQKNEKVEFKSDVKTESFKFTNGDLVKVKEINNDSLILEDGRKINQDFKNLDYGYVSTSYGSQGKTCDHVIVAMTNAGGKALSQEQFYVSTSRGREGIDIFVEDKEYIKARIEALGNRPFNLELMDKDQREIINLVKFESIKNLKEKCNTVASDVLKNNPQKEELPKTTPLEKMKEIKTHWKENLKDLHSKIIEPLKKEISIRIIESRNKIDKELYPLDKEPMTLHEKIISKSKNLGMDRNI